MDETATTDTTQTDETTEDQGDSSGPKQLREALKREKAENVKLRKQAMTGAFEKVGLDPETGLGKAIAKEYKGEPTVDALAQYAKEEYGHEAPAGDEHPQEKQIVEGQTQADQLQQQSTSTTPLTHTDALREAEAQRDYDTAGALKAQQLRSRLN